MDWSSSKRWCVGLPSVPICMCLINIIFWTVLRDISPIKPMHLFTDSSRRVNNGYFTNESGNLNKKLDGVYRIAVGLGITSVGVRGVNENNVKDKFLYFQVFLPSFCKTFSKQFDYKFFLAYDQIDPFFINQTNLELFAKNHHEVCEDMCGKDISSEFYKCDHWGKPAWAQNDAMMEAYKEKYDFYYRVNDDTRLDTPNWTEAFIGTLQKNDPPLAGVVGPRHRQGNGDILTHDFVHRTHIDVFGYYYPKLFKDWWADGWITKVYQPGRSHKLESINVTHTLSGRFGRSRYNVSDTLVGRLLNHKIKEDRKILKRFLRRKKLGRL